MNALAERHGLVPLSSMQRGITRGPGKAYSHVLTRNSGGNFGNRVNFRSISRMAEVLISSGIGHVVVSELIWGSLIVSKELGPLGLVLLILRGRNLVLSSSVKLLRLYLLDWR
jgi:hypothetical protein